MIPVLQTGSKIHSENKAARTTAFQLELCILLQDTILSEQQFCEEALGVLSVSICRLCIHTRLMMTVSLEQNN